ncbi:MAG: hypothetical protein JST04_03290 [Bdellovibrionales bacterium]|nr:hypothetical protein [Bdellovibrionales bacterium]
MQQSRLFVLGALLAPALLGAKKLDLRPVAVRPMMPSAASALTQVPESKPSPTLDPYFGFGAPSKNPADYASESDPYNGAAKNRRIGMPVEYMGPAARIGDGPGVASLQSYNMNGMQGFSGNSGAPNPANYPAPIHVPAFNPPPVNVAPISVR